MLRRIEGGWFETDTHEYFNEQMRWVPSCTQVMSLANYVDYRAINPAVVENAGRRGTNVHFLTEQYDLEESVPPDWISEDERIRFVGYLRWKGREGFIAKQVELPIIGSIYGMQVGCTIDRVGVLSRNEAIVELKFTAKAEWYWGLQLAAQEMILTGKPQTGRYLRVACHVDSAGIGRTITFRDPADSQKFIFALGVCYTRMDAGQDIRGEIFNSDL